MEILNKTATIKEETNTMEVISEVKSTYTIDDLQSKISNIQRQKSRIIRDSQTLKQEFDILVIEEQEYQEYLTQLTSTIEESITIIE